MSSIYRASTIGALIEAGRDDGTRHRRARTAGSLTHQGLRELARAERWRPEWHGHRA